MYVLHGECIENSMSVDVHASVCMHVEARVDLHVSSCVAVIFLALRLGGSHGDPDAQVCTVIFQRCCLA